MVSLSAGQCSFQNGQVIGTGDVPWDSDDHRPWRHDRSSNDDRVRADDALIAYLGIIQDGRVHPDDAVVSDSGIVHDGRMPERHVLADRAYVDDRVILDVASFADDHWALIASKNSEWPDARSLAYLNVPDDDGGRIDVDVLSHGE